MTSPASAPYGLRNAVTFLWHLRVHPRHPAYWISVRPGGIIRCHCGKRWEDR